MAKGHNWGLQRRKDVALKIALDAALDDALGGSIFRQLSRLRLACLGTLRMFHGSDLLSPVINSVIAATQIATFYIFHPHNKFSIPKLCSRI